MQEEMYQMQSLEELDDMEEIPSGILTYIRSNRSLSDGNEEKLKKWIDDHYITTSDETMILLLNYLCQFNYDEISKMIYSREDAKVNICDSKGKTPLLVATFHNKISLVELLLGKKADICARDEQGQNIIHYAVRNSSSDVLEKLHATKRDPINQLLRELLCEKDDQQRTPLKLAAEQNMTKMAEIILGILKDTGKNDEIDGSTLSTMIMNMPHLAIIAFDLLKCDVRPYHANRKKDTFYLDRLEDNKKDKNDESAYDKRTPFKVAVEKLSASVLRHPIIKKLVDEKWKWKWYQICFWLYLFYYALFLMLWITIIAYPSVQEKHIYNDAWPWRIILSVAAVAMMLSLFVMLIIKAVLSFRSAKKYRAYNLSKLDKDLENCMFDQEEIKLKEQKERWNTYNSKVLNYLAKIPCCKTIADGLSASYFTNYWNILHIIALTLLSVTTILHIIDIARHTEDIAQWTARIACFALILIWIRLLMFARASEFFGPMISIIIQLFPNILKYFVLFLILYIPFVACFWLIFGGVEQQMAANITSEELISFHRVAVVVLQLTYGTDTAYQDIRAVDELMGTILVISFLSITAIIGLNLFIALLSDTFQRIYENAQVNALYQKARMILVLEEIPFIGPIIQRKFRCYLEKKCEHSKVSDIDDDDDENKLYHNEIQELKEYLNELTAMIKKSDQLPQSTVTPLPHNIITILEHMMPNHSDSLAFDDGGDEEATDYDDGTGIRATCKGRIQYVQKYNESKGSKRVLKFVRS